jgi:alkanesulfonate monooxygenase SsuD/methylene tetrahydromethanopterin reductase-like flavin-dependent oxidoreductase (luciferase family)
MTVHDGHCTYLQPGERQFMTPELIRAAGGLVGTPDEIVAMLREREAAGLREVTLLPPMHCARENFRDFAKSVMERY